MSRTTAETFDARQNYRKREIRHNNAISLLHPELRLYLEEENLTLYTLIDTEQQMEHERIIRFGRERFKYSGRMKLYEVRKDKHNKKIRDLRFKDECQMRLINSELTDEFFFVGSGEYFFQIIFFNH